MGFSRNKSLLLGAFLTGIVMIFVTYFNYSVCGLSSLERILIAVIMGGIIGFTINRLIGGDRMNWQMEIPVMEEPIHITVRNAVFIVSIFLIMILIYVVFQL